MPILDLTQTLPALYDKYVEHDWVQPVPYDANEVNMSEIDLSDVLIEVLEDSADFTSKNLDKPTYVKPHPYENKADSEVKRSVTYKCTTTDTYTTKTTIGIKRNATDNGKFSLKLGDIGLEFGLTQALESTLGKEDSKSTNRSEEFTDNMTFSIPPHSTVNLLEIHQIQKVTLKYKMNLRISGKVKFVSEIRALPGVFRFPYPAELDIVKLLKFAPDQFSKDPQYPDSLLFKAEGVFQYTFETVRWILQPENFVLNDRLKVPSALSSIYTNLNESEEITAQFHYYSSKEAQHLNDILPPSTIHQEYTRVSYENRKLKETKKYLTDFFNSKITLRHGENKIDLTEQDLNYIKEHASECKVQ